MEGASAVCHAHEPVLVRARVRAGISFPLPDIHPMSQHTLFLCSSSTQIHYNLWTNPKPFAVLLLSKPVFVVNKFKGGLNLADKPVH